MIVFTFDMDGTIIDSRAAVVESYKLAGVDMPDDAWHKPWQAWCDAEAHAMKCRVYPAVLRRMGVRLPPADLLEITHGRVLTAASQEATAAVKKFLGFDFDVLATSVCADEKIDIIRALTGEGGVTGVIHVDDDRGMGLRLVKAVPNVMFLEVTIHEGVYHLHSQRGEVQRWTLSSWLPDVTIV